MAFEPIKDAHGQIIINGAVVDFELADAEIAIVMLLKLEQFNKALPLIGGEPPRWTPELKPGAHDEPTARNPSNLISRKPILWRAFECIHETNA